MTTDPSIENTASTAQGDQSKTVKVFDWSAVDVRLKRRLLADIERDRQVARATSGELDTWLASRYGRPPKTAAFTSKEMGSVLLEHWLPALPREELGDIQLSLSHHLREQPTSNRKSDVLQFLQTRRLAAGYRKILRRTFLQVHKVDRPVQSKSSSTKPLTSRYEHERLGATPDHEPYPHQLDAHASLTKAIDLSSTPADTGLIVLPTGAGKTATMVRWLVEEALPKGVRVLWLAHQRELLIQARDAFAKVIATQPPGAPYVSRMLYGNVGLNPLGSPDTDIAFVSLPLIANKFELQKAKQARLASYLARPTVVVVDEAHHAGARTYRKVIEACLNAQSVGLVGLSATPWPTSVLASAHVKALFIQTFYEIDAETLTEQGILARPVVHTIQTDEVVRLTEDERERNQKAADLAPEVLEMLDTSQRNKVIVEAYRNNSETYGKCLVFAGTITHADRLGKAFKSAGIPTRVVHGQADTSRTRALKWFEELDEPGVIVSVRMLTEGVDLPSAESVILARPTTSRILLKQMIGRALRGVRAGGSAKAHIINLRDHWTNLEDILEPPEVLDLADIELVDERRRTSRIGDPWELPPIVDADGQDLPAAVQAEIERTMFEGEAHSSGDQGGQNLPFISIQTASLAGWYVLANRNVAVLDHQRSGFADLIARASNDLRGTPMYVDFDDTPEPLPSPRALQAVVDHVRSFGPPEFHDFIDMSLPFVVANELADAPRTEAERQAHIQDRWSRGAIRLQMSLRDFHAAVDDACQRLARRDNDQPSGLEPERSTTLKTPAPSGEDDVLLPRLTIVERDLPQIFNGVVKWMRANLPNVAHRLDPLPKCTWTKKPVGELWASWGLVHHGRQRGQARILVNKMLSATPDQVPDELLGYLIYHELLHHVLSTRGHDVGFRNYEAKWPNAVELDAMLDTLDERYDVDPASYR